jgi:hypothetical protein
MRRAFPDIRSDLDVTSWSRLTTTADGRFARELANGGVIRVR